MDEAIVRLFAALPLQGPGSNQDTMEVLHRVRDALPPAPALADFGCGTGRSTLVLAQMIPDATVTGVDFAAPFLDVLRDHAERLHLLPRVQARLGNMLTPDFTPGSLDLVWSEGAAYATGLEAALRVWQPLLRAEGRCVVSDCTWLTEDPPPSVAAFWREAYPAMGSRAGNIRRAEAAGFEVLGTHLLSDAGWDGYHGLLSASVTGAPAGALPSWFAEGIAREVKVRREAAGSFGYVFYVLRPNRR